MKLYKLFQTIKHGYDVYDSCVVAAKNEDDAKLIHPSGYKDLTSPNWDCDWVEPKDVHVEEIGTARKHIVRGVICASFNAG